MPAMNSLPGKQQRFLDAYALSHNAHLAAKTAGYTDRSAPQMAKRILEKPIAQEYLSKIQLQSRAIVSYDLATAMTESLEVIEHAKQTRNSMAYFKAVEHRAKLSGLLIERIHIEKVDLSEALRQANLRILDVIQPGLELPTLASDSLPEPTETGGGGTGGGGGNGTAL